MAEVNKINRTILKDWLTKYRDLIIAGKYFTIFKQMQKDNTFAAFIPAIATFLYEQGIDIFKSVSEIPSNVFAGSDILSINIPAQIKTIDKGAFKNCASLKSVNLSSGLLQIGDSAFANTAIINIDIPDTVTSVGRSTFENCAELETLKLPENSNFTEISERICQGCSKLKTVNISQYVKKLGGRAFNDSPNVVLTWDKQPASHLTTYSSDNDFLKSHIQKKTGA